MLRLYFIFIFTLLPQAIAASGDPAKSAHDLLCPSFFARLMIRLPVQFRGHAIESFPANTTVEDIFLQIRYKHFTFERGKVLPGLDPEINAILQEVEAVGGEVRVLGKEKHYGILPDFKVKEDGYSYFRMNSDGRPILAFEENTAASTIRHELQHFRDWKKHRDFFQAQGKEEKLAAELAYMKMRTMRGLLATEKNAVTEELSGSGISIFSPEYPRRMAYPLLATMTKSAQLNKNKLQLTEAVQKELAIQAREVIALAFSIHRVRLYALDALYAENKITAQELAKRKEALGGLVKTLSEMDYKNYSDATYERVVLVLQSKTTQEWAEALAGNGKEI